MKPGGKHSTMQRQRRLSGSETALRLRATADSGRRGSRQPTGWLQPLPCRVCVWSGFYAVLPAAVQPAASRRTRAGQIQIRMRKADRKVFKTYSLCDSSLKMNSNHTQQASLKNPVMVFSDDRQHALPLALRPQPAGPERVARSGEAYRLCRLAEWG